MLQFAGNPSVTSAGGDCWNYVYLQVQTFGALDPFIIDDHNIQLYKVTKLWNYTFV